VSFLGLPVGLNPPRHQKTLEILGIVTNVTKLVEMRIKHALACRRANEYSSQIQPMIQTPGHGTLPSGHAAEAFVQAIILYRLVRIGSGGDAQIDKSDPSFVQLMRHAERIATNRVVAGVHFPVDSVAGMVLALTLSEFFVSRFT